MRDRERPSRTDPEEYFNRWAKTYDRSPAQLFFFRWIHQRVLREVRNGGHPPLSILDIGCGTGRLLEHLSRMFPEATLAGADAAEDMVDRCRKRLPDADIRHCAVEELPFETNRFDLITSTVSFHHWSDQESGLSEVGRVLGEEGRFVLADLADLPWWLAWHRNDGDFVSAEDRLAMLDAAEVGATTGYRWFFGIVRFTISRRG